MALKLNHFQRTHMFLKKKNKLSTLYSNAFENLSHLDAFSRTITAELEELQRQNKISFETLAKFWKQPADAESKLKDAAFLGAQFKETVQYPEMQDDAMLVKVNYVIDEKKGTVS